MLGVSGPVRLHSALGSMAIPEHLRFRFHGFSSYRVAFVLAVGSFFLLPVHFQVSCDASGAVFSMSLFILAATLGLSFTIPRQTPHRARPASLAFFAAIAHMLCTH